MTPKTFTIDETDEICDWIIALQKRKAAADPDYKTDAQLLAEMAAEAGITLDERPAEPDEDENADG